MRFLLYIKYTSIVFGMFIISHRRSVLPGLCYNSQNHPIEGCTCQRILVSCEYHPAPIRRSYRLRARERRTPP